MRGPRQAAQRMSLSQRRRHGAAVSAIRPHAVVDHWSVTASVGRPVWGISDSYVFDLYEGPKASTCEGFIVRYAVSRALDWVYDLDDRTRGARDAVWGELYPRCVTRPLYRVS